jgi:hypothetical protein
MKKLKEKKNYYWRTLRSKKSSRNKENLEDYITLQILMHN